MKSQLFKTAWAIRSNFANFSEALKAAWKTMKLSLDLKRKTVSFKFKKIDGSIREAVGTLFDTPAILGTKAKNYSVLTFFDVECEQWRSAKIVNLIF